MGKKPFYEFTKEFDLCYEVLELYRELSRSTHTMGVKYQESVHRNDIVPTYQQKYFLEWSTSLLKVYETVSTVLILRYRKLFKTKSEETTSILSLLSENRLTQLEVSETG